VARHKGTTASHKQVTGGVSFPRWALAAMVLSVVLRVVSLFLGGNDNQDSPWASLSVVVLILAAVAVLGAVWLRWLSQGTKRAVAAHPDAWLVAKVVVSGRHDLYSSLLLEPTGLTLLSRSGSAKAGPIAWSAIVGADPIQVASGSRKYPGLRIGFTTTPPMDLFAVAWLNADRQLNDRALELIRRNAAGASATPRSW
jgi:hypothetical protein